MSTLHSDIEIKQTHKDMNLVKKMLLAKLKH